jgi:hypothetical protein
MTRMLPPLIHPQVVGETERRAYKAIRSAIDSEGWICLHCLALPDVPRTRRPDADYVLLTPMGVFVIDICGGGYQLEGQGWRHTNRFGESVLRTTNPFDRAAGAASQMEGWAVRTFGKSHRLARIVYGYGVVSPEGVFDSYGHSGSRPLVYDPRDHELQFTDFIRRLAKNFSSNESWPREQPERDELELLAKRLRCDFDLIPPIGADLVKKPMGIILPTSEQYAVIDANDSRDEPRIVVRGAAGVGKTTLVVECAVRETIRFATRTLILTYNRLLAAYLNHAVKVRFPDAKFEAWSVYAFFDQLIRKAQLSEELRLARQDKTDEEVYGEVFPQFARRALSMLPIKKYGSLFLDEAQDYLRQSVLDTLDQVLEGGMRGGRWRAFFDANKQGSIYGTNEPETVRSLAQHAKVVSLTRNLRATASISEGIDRIVQPRVSADSEREGPAIEIAWHTVAQDEKKVLRSLIYRLYKEGVPAGRITVLSPKPSSQVCARKVSDPPIAPMTEEDVFPVVAGKSLATMYSTISLFKGLENDHIILTDIEGITGPVWRAILYAGMSRARVGLYILLPATLRDEYENLPMHGGQSSTSMLL